MTKTPISEAFVGAWLRDLIVAWTSRDVESALGLFSNCRIYKETPFSHNAAAEPDGIKRLWEEVALQSDIVVSGSILGVGLDTAVIAYEARMSVGRSLRHSSGIWYIRYRESRCEEFHQWFMVDPAS